MKKFLALTLVLVTVASLFAGCGKPAADGVTPPSVSMEDTLENRQAAIVELAKAFYYKNPYNQYDNRPLCLLGNASGRRGVVDDRNTPEYASADMTMYNVCTSYAYHVVYGAIGFKLLDNARECLTDRLCMGKDVPKELVLYQYEGTSDMAKNHAAATEMMAMVQPGDLINYARENGFGHTMIYVGDITGDGRGDILHVDGGKYNMETGKDNTEPNGAVLLNKKTDPNSCAEEFLLDPSYSGYLGEKLRFSLIRPVLISAEEYPLTDSVKSRMLFSGLEITYTNGRGHYGAAVKGEELTYALTIENHSDKTHESILVQIPVPEGTELVSAGGVEMTGKTVKWNLTMAPGEVVECTYTVRVIGEVGSRITAKGAYVHAIPLPEITTAIVSAAMDSSAIVSAASAATGKTGAEFAEAVYASLGKPVEIPTAEELLKSLFDTMKMGDGKVYVRKTAEKLDETGAAHLQMMIPDYFGGQRIRTDCDADEPRVNETRYYDLQAGDVIIFAENILFDEPIFGVFDGEELIFAANGQVHRLAEEDYIKLLRYDFFIGLRPAQSV